jgi:hypothetical protein
MAKFWRRKAQQDTHNAQPAHNAQPPPGSADLAAWAREADVSRLSPQTRREAEDYLNKYRHMNLELSQQMGWRVMAAIEAQVTPSPPPFAQPLDVIATVVALRRKQPGTGLSSPPALVPPSLGYEASHICLWTSANCCPFPGGRACAEPARPGRTPPSGGSPWRCGS